jgi:putative membrane protein
MGRTALAPAARPVLSSPGEFPRPVPLMTLHSIALVLAALVAVLHAGFLVLEMFLWDHPVGRRIFRLDPDFSKRSATLAANQGLYNGFLAAGLGWGLVAARDDVLTFFLVYGGMTVKRTILFTQGIPALLALIALLAG